MVYRYFINPFYNVTGPSITVASSRILMSKSIHVSLAIHYFLFPSYLYEPSLNTARK